MFRQRYNEIIRKRWYDVAFLALISVITEIFRNIYHRNPDLLQTAGWFLGHFALLFAVYILVNELTHRHRQAFVTAAILGSMPGVFYLSATTLTHVWCFAFLTGSAYLSIKALRRYGSQWKNMSASAILFGIAIQLGGVWPVFHYYMPFFIVWIIAIRPIIRYKTWSILTAILLVILIIAAPFITHLTDLWPTIQHQFSIWQGVATYGCLFTPTTLAGFKIFPLFQSGLWFIPGLVAGIYALRSQRIHGDMTALIGIWWFILAFVLIALRPATDKDNMLTILTPVSFCIGAYFNLLSLPQKLRKFDRRVFRITLITTAAVQCALSMILLYPFFPQFTLYGPFALSSVLLLVFTLYIVNHKYNKHKLSIRITETGYIILSMLWTATLSISL